MAPLRRASLLLLSAAVANLSVVVAAFCNLPTSFHRQKSPFSRHWIVTAAAKKKNKNGRISLPENEFSRKVHPERILRTRRAYVVNLKANHEERSALAERFELSDIARLEASLNLRPEWMNAATNKGVEVEGTVVATVTQTCVRTNEDFRVDVEFPLYAIVRPVVPMLQQGMTEEKEEEDYDDDPTSPHGRSGGRNNNKSRKTNNYYRLHHDRNIEQMDVMELQRLLEQDILGDTAISSSSSSDDEDVLMEDEAIYVMNGLLDVAELVSQLFWLQLDPYPKKPGSNPVRTSISG